MAQLRLFFVTVILIGSTVSAGNSKTTATAGPTTTAAAPIKIVCSNTQMKLTSSNNISIIGTSPKGCSSPKQNSNTDIVINNCMDTNVSVAITKTEGSVVVFVREYIAECVSGTKSNDTLSVTGTLTNINAPSSMETVTMKIEKMKLTMDFQKNGKDVNGVAVLGETIQMKISTSQTLYQSWKLLPVSCSAVAVSKPSLNINLLSGSCPKTNLMTKFKTVGITVLSDISVFEFNDGNGHPVNTIVFQCNVTVCSSGDKFCDTTFNKTCPTVTRQRRDVDILQDASDRTHSVEAILHVSSGFNEVFSGSGRASVSAMSIPVFFILWLILA